jgi:hypothetical protein
MSLGSGIEDTGKLIPDPGFRVQKGTGSRIRNTDSNNAIRYHAKNMVSVSYLRMSVLLAGVLH